MAVLPGLKRHLHPHKQKSVPLTAPIGSHPVCILSLTPVGANTPAVPLIASLYQSPSKSML